MLGVWGVAAAAGALHPGLEPTPVAQRASSAPATTSAEPTEAASAAETLPPAKPVVKLPPAKPVASAPKPAAPKPAAAPVVPSGKYVVVIDPGHGGELSGSEPLGPWAGAPMRPKTNYGAEGEAQVALSVGLKLRPMLERQGVKVVMVRTGPAAISNKTRAQIANNAHADLFLRLHCDGQDGGSSVHGISMQVPSDTRAWAPIAPSRKAGELILAALIRQTGAANRGMAPRGGDSGGLVGFNWSKVPTALPEMGFLSNPAERAKLKSAAYQNVLAKAIADGTMQYLRTTK